MSWTRVAGATGYRVEELIGRKWVKIANLGSGSTSFVVPGLKPDTTYSFDVGCSRGATTTWAKYQSATTSNNWSGYVAATNLFQPQPNSVTEVSGSWIVPKVTPTGPSTGSTYSSVWVGIDGWNTKSISSPTVEQVGTSENVINGLPRYWAWWEMWSSVNTAAFGAYRTSRAGRFDRRLGPIHHRGSILPIDRRQQPERLFKFQHLCNLFSVPESSGPTELCRVDRRSPVECEWQHRATGGLQPRHLHQCFRSDRRSLWPDQRLPLAV